MLRASLRLMFLSMILEIDAMRYHGFSGYKHGYNDAIDDVMEYIRKYSEEVLG